MNDETTRTVLQGNPVAVLLFVAILITLVLLARWVFRDAQAVGFSKTAALAWAVGTCLSLVIFLFYMIARVMMRQRSRM